MINRNFKMQIIDDKGNVVKSCTVDHFLGKVNLDTGYRKEMKDFFGWDYDDAAKLAQEKANTALAKAKAIAALSTTKAA